MQLKLLMTAFLALTLAACGGSSSDSDGDSGGGDSGGGDSGSTETVVLTGAVAMPEQMELVGASEGTSAAPIDVSSLPSESDYITARQNIYVELEATRPISFIDDLLCFTNQTKPLAMLGEGPYLAWNNAGRCFEEDGDGGDDDGNDNNIVSYVNVVANSTGGGEDPMTVRAWIEDYAGDSGSDGGPGTILMMGEVTQVPSEENPYGVFSLAYGLLPSLESTEADSLGKGQVSAQGGENGDASFTLYQQEMWSDNGLEIECDITASVDYNETTQTGVARTGRDCTPETQWDPNKVYALAVNENFIHMAVAASNSELDAQTYETEVCLSRDDFDEVAWNYALFNKADGSEVEINSGFPVKVDYDGDGTGSDANGFEGYGHIGYWGAWRDDGQNFDDGEMVQQATYDDTVGESYTVRVSPGRLVRNSIETEALTNLDGVEFYTWMHESQYSIGDINEDMDTDDGFEVVVEVNDADDGFNVVAYVVWEEQNGEYMRNQTTLANPVAIVLASDETLYMHSNQLGGDAQFTQGSDAIRFFGRSYVNGSETGTGELFDSATSVTLKCFERCLDVGVTTNDLDQEQNAFVGDSYDTAQDYSFALADLTLRIATDSVGFASNVTEQDLQGAQFWNWGMHSGPMVKDGAATSISDFHTKLGDGTITEFYVWETGPFDWMQGIRLVNASDEVVTFDAPIAFKYTHATANDRNGDSAADGQTFLLEYGGYGNLWGLPWVEDQESGHYYPLIRGIADAVEMGPNDIYIVKALDIEQKMSSASSAHAPDSAEALAFCSDIALGTPSQAVPSDITLDVFNIGTMPDVTDQAPSVVDGELVNED